MNNHPKRLKDIELSLTPSQRVFLWMQKALMGNYTDSLLDFESPDPFVTIVDWVDNIVKTSSVGESETFVDRATIQARKEAYFLLLLVRQMNDMVLSQFPKSNREYVFLLAYLAAIDQSTRLSVIAKATLGATTTIFRAASRTFPELQEMVTMHRALSIPEEAHRRITLKFVEEILCLEGTVSRISAEHFGGRPILYADSAARLTQQLQLVDQALELSNSIAARLRFPQLKKEQIRDDLSSRINEELSQLVLGVRGMTLEQRGMEEVLKRLAADYRSALTSSDDYGRVVSAPLTGQRLSQSTPKPLSTPGKGNAVRKNG
jgi:hypothetical protein